MYYNSLHLYIIRVVYYQADKAPVLYKINLLIVQRSIYYRL